MTFSGFSLLHFYEALLLCGWVFNKQNTYSLCDSYCWEMVLGHSQQFSAIDAAVVSYCGHLKWKCVRLTVQDIFVFIIDWICFVFFTSWPHWHTLFQVMKMWYRTHNVFVNQIINQTRWVWGKALLQFEEWLIMQCLVTVRWLPEKLKNWIPCDKKQVTWHR